MDLHEFLTMLGQHWVLSIFGGLIAIGLLQVIAQTLKFYTWYFVVILGALLAFAFTSHKYLYFFAFVLGTLTACAEIVGKFSDEPMKALKTPAALLYHLANGVISAFSVWLLILSGMKTTSDLEALKIVMAGGLGSMLVMRSKLFNLKLGNEEIAFGPDQIIKAFMGFMERAIDRVRARSRVEIVTDVLKNRDFGKMYDYWIAMIDARQALEDADRTKLKAAIDKIKQEAPESPELKSFRLGFLLLKETGEECLRQLCKTLPPDSSVGGQLLPSKEPGTSLLNIIQNPFKKEKVISYFAYGSNISTRALCVGLGFADSETEKLKVLIKPRKAELKEYRMVFNRVALPDSAEGYPNLEKDPAAQTEGVLYELTEQLLGLLNQSESNGRQEEIAVNVEGKQVKAITYFGKTTAEGLKPSKSYIDTMLAGAQ